MTARISRPGSRCCSAACMRVSGWPMRGVTAVHSLSYPLGGKYGISHGLANTLMLPRVMEFNLPGALEKFAIIAEMMGEIAMACPCGTRPSWPWRRWNP